MIKKVLEDKKNPVVIDVGCNVGEFSEFILQQNNSSIIYAFDLHEGLASVLKKKFINQQFFFNPLALSDYRGFGRINSSIKYDRKAYITKSNGLKKIKVDTLDNSLKRYKISEITILKIDTEGNDFKVLKGAVNTLRFTEIVIFEIMYKILENGTTPNTVIDFLRGRGFNYFYRSTKFFGLVPIDKIQPYEVMTQNIVAAKNKLDR